MMNAEDTLSQVKFLVEDVGKRQARSKKRITWVFDFGGHEHTVTLVWSKRTGKRFVYMAGNEVFFDRKKGASVFFHKWKTRDEALNLHILASAATPSKKYVSPGFRKYELIINGQRFATFPNQDGTPLEEQEAGSVPSSIFDIIYPNGYHGETSSKGEAAYNSHAKLSQEVRERVAKQSTYNAQTQ